MGDDLSQSRCNIGLQQSALFMKVHRVGTIARLAIISVLAIPKLSPPQEANPRISLVISAPKSVALDAQVVIDIKLKNISQEPLYLSAGEHGGLPDGYKYIVRDQKGDLVPEDRLCDRPVSPGTVRPPCILPGSSLMGFLKPGESWLQGAVLTALYRFEQPGTYTIQISRSDPGLPTVYSNVVKLSVLAKR